ncbi:F0F1 ATP synthase subunit A [Luteimicrobium subarcticum]|uniref:ATP synthase subunit a n=1 Tax=Luteimicrobium subarcticum TaxID=620910 RepID=A0A2M8W1K8_9MICO|nr:F0F1 ATP synthase subunit A [Luteimicrobium subarcticum]PJI84788.1 ATP synthase F0 subcomplex A subunit [Luteimicrobium subarcticum]
MTFLATTPILAAESDGFHAPSIDDFFPPAIWFDGTWFEINRITLVRFVALIALLLVFGIAAKRATLVPGRFQAAIEWILDFCRYSITYDTLGEKDGKKYVPLITAIFCSVFFFNITGVIPFLNIAGTSVIGLPLIFALWAYVMYFGAGIKKLGLGKFLKVNLLPAGVPKGLYLLLTPIEFLQLVIIRPATLMIRLLANMMAGHLLLALCFAGTQYLLFSAEGGLKVFGVVTFAGGFAFFLLEIFVAALQAYVFAILTALYIQMSSAEEH